MNPVQTIILLKQTFIALLLKFTQDKELAQELWSEIEIHYNSPGRHYHTLKHLECMLEQCSAILKNITKRDAFLFGLFYHDIIYDPLKQTNEALSAAFAEKRMGSFSADKDMINSCKNFILATKTHEPCTDDDINYFTDADLSVLGKEWESYAVYCSNIRREYSAYDDDTYKSGRKRVLHHFLKMKHIFKTAHFYNKFEKQAIANLKNELAGLV